MGMDAVVERLIEKELELSTLKPDDVFDLVSQQLQSFYKENHLVPPNPLYPFEKKQLQALGEARLTVRETLQWCSKNIPKGAIIDPVKRLEKIYQEVRSNLEDFLEDSDLIAYSIAFGFNCLCGETIEGVTIIDVDLDVKPYSKHNGYIQFKVIADEHGKTEKIGVAVAQHNHGRSVGAAIKYLTNYQVLDLTRGCLVRQKSIPAHWQVANQYLDILCNHQSGEWVGFREEDIEPLVTIFSMTDAIDWDEFSKEDFTNFIKEKHPFDQNPILLEILSNPSGEVPKDLVDEDKEIEALLGQIVDTDDANITDLELALAM
jgi:hypothetical protein